MFLVPFTGQAAGLLNLEPINVSSHPSFKYSAEYSLVEYIGILVRDRAARERLRAEFGKLGQVLYVCSHVPKVHVIIKPLFTQNRV